MCMSVEAKVTWEVSGTHRTVCGSQFLSPAVWVLGFEPRSLDSHWAILLAPGYILKRIHQDVETQTEHPPLQMNLPRSRCWPWWEQACWVPLRSGLLPWSCQTERMHRNIALLVGFYNYFMCVLGQDRHTNVDAGSPVSHCQRKTKTKHPATYKRCENKSYMDIEISIWIKIYFNLHLSFWIFTERHIYRWIQMCEHTSVTVERWVFLVCSPRT